MSSTPCRPTTPSPPARSTREALERKLGLDQPIPVQYARWLGDIVLHGSLGQSLLGRFSVNEKIAGRLPVTIQLGVTALVIGLLIALPVGIYSAIRQDTTPDYVGRSVAVVGLATPNFWLALMVMLYPAIWWGWSPPMRLIRFSADPLGNLGMFIIPGAILGTAMAAATMRMTRTMMLEVLRQDYVRTAWSKGLKERAVVVRHAVKKRHHPGDYAGGLAAANSGGRLGHHGEHLQSAWAGSSDAECSRRPRLHAGLGNQPAVRQLRRGGERAHRPDVWVPRSENPL